LTSGNRKFVELKNKHVKIQVERDGSIKKIQTHNKDINVKTGFEMYLPAVGTNEGAENRASGAYIFRPNGTETVPVGDPISATVFKGPLFEEIQQVYSNWISQTVRLYQDEKVAEFNWVVGPIPIEDGGKEIIVKYSSDLSSGDKFSTDSNGRGSIQRQRDQRETWELDLTEPIAANYYPVNSRISIRDESGNGQLHILTDRSQGGASMKSGEVELMLHRRLLHDDAFGVGEALNETAFGVGLVARGTHRMMLCEDNCEEEATKEAENIFAAPVLLFGETCAKARSVGSELNLPASLKLLTLEKWAANQILVRLENLVGTAASLQIGGLFPGQTIQQIEERTLDGNALKSRMSRFSWRKDSNHIPRLDDTASEDETTKYMNMEDDITIPPQSIKTLMVYF